jgi:hypothetical protein
MTGFGENDEAASLLDDLPAGLRRLFFRRVVRPPGRSDGTACSGGPGQARSADMPPLSRVVVVTNDRKADALTYRVPLNLRTEF